MSTYQIYSNRYDNLEAQIEIAPYQEEIEEINEWMEELLNDIEEGTK